MIFQLLHNSRDHWNSTRLVNQLDLNSLRCPWLMSAHHFTQSQHWSSDASPPPSSQDKDASYTLASRCIFFFFCQRGEDDSPGEKPREAESGAASLPCTLTHWRLIHSAFDHIFGTDTIWCKQGGEESRSGSKPPSEISHFTQTSLTPTRSPSFSPPLSLAHWL